MSTLLNRGFRFGNRCIETAAAESVVYKRGALVISDAMPATLSAQQIEQVTEGGAAIVGRQFTWRLKKNSLVVDGSRVRPERDDLIEWISGGKTYSFSVLPDGKSDSQEVDPRSDFIPANAKLNDVA